LRHAISCQIAGGLLGRGASGIGPALEGRQPELAFVVAGGGTGRDGSGSAAKIGGMDRQTLRDWVHRFNAAGPEGLIDNWTKGLKPRLSAEQLAEFAVMVEVGPDREKDGVVRWRRVDLKRVIGERFGVEFHERYVGKLLKKLGFSHMSARPRHPGQDERIVEAFKKRMARPVCNRVAEIDG
jgi:transposase